MVLQTIFSNYRQVVTKHYLDTSGRVGRSEFWYFVLANFVFAILAAILQSITFLPLLAIYNLAMVLPAGSMGARRLQDTGRDGRFIWIFVAAGLFTQLFAAIGVVSTHALGILSFLFFGPVVLMMNMAFLAASLILFYFWCQPGNPCANAYGLPPPTFDPSDRVCP